MSDTKSYNEEEFQHALAKETAKFQIVMLTKDVDVLKQQNGKDLTEIKLQMGQVIGMIKDQSLEQDKNKKEFKAEIEKDFASKADLKELQNEIKSLWLKITVTVSTIVGTGLVLGWILATANSVKGLVH